MQQLLDNLIIGGLHFGGAIKKKEVQEIVAIASDFGISRYETAPLYGQGNSMAVLAESLRRIKDARIFLKYGLSENRKSSKFSVMSFPLKVRNIINKLQNDIELFEGKVSCFLFHSPHEKHEYEEIIAHIIESRSQLDIGISNFSPEETVEFRRKLPMAYHPRRFHIQFQANVYEQRHLTTIGADANKFGNVKIINRCLCRGLLTSRIIRNNMFPPDGTRAAKSERIREFFEKEKINLRKILTLLNDASEKTGLSIESLSLAFLLDMVAEPKLLLIGVSNSQQLKELVQPLFRRETRDISKYISLQISEFLTEIVENNPTLYFET